MKIIALGDTHGRPYWKTITGSNEFDKVVFIGDYFDSREFILPGNQKKNFTEIIAFKKAYPEKVVLLFGNHDFHYLPGIEDRYSSFQPECAEEIGQMIENAIKGNLMQMCYMYQHFLFTHAGITKTWSRVNGIGTHQLEDSVNNLFRTKPGVFRFTPGKNRDPYGDDVTQSPIWVRPSSLRSDRIDGFTQIVGHTQQPELVLTNDVVLIDTLGTCGQYLKIDHHILSVGGDGYDF